ncbi:dharma [Fundulus heteroclitus]|uniref:dharma n=1 Tax=Fundulus heteroclitus TaxID=8078 RepID=UPI00165CE1E0|nr:dharma [Fundulus heteroclitus]
MDGSRVSDFSIKRILSPQLGRRPPQPEPEPDGGQRGVPGGTGDCASETGSVRAEPRSTTITTIITMQRSASAHIGLQLLKLLLTLFITFKVNCSMFVASLSAGGSDAAHSGYQKARMRTVFTDSQSRELEALFHITDYPATEARAQLARNTGLSEETVRVWFKNRRARRKRQRSGSKVRSPCPSPSAAAASSEKKTYSSSP